MSLLPSNRQMNWSGVVFTPVGGVAIVLNGVTNVEIDDQVSIAGFSGDGDKYTTTQVQDFADPKITITLANIQAMESIPYGARGVLVAVHNDAVNQGVTGGGAIKYTMANAVIGTKTRGGQYRQYGQGTLGFMTYSPDGYTNPVSTSAA